MKRYFIGAGVALLIIALIALPIFLTKKKLQKEAEKDAKSTNTSNQQPAEPDTES